MNRLRNIPVYLGRKGKMPRFSSIRYPSVPLDVNDIYITTTIGDRLDSLSKRFSILLSRFDKLRILFCF